jgi:hypothetical protein
LKDKANEGKGIGGKVSGGRGDEGRGSQWLHFNLADKKLVIRARIARKKDPDISAATLSRWIA